MNPLIALQGRDEFDPVAVTNRVNTNRLQEQSLRANDFDMEQKQAGLARQNQIRNLLASLPDNSTPEQVNNLLLRAGAPDQASAYMKATREAGKAQAEGDSQRRQGLKFTFDQAVAASKHLGQMYGALNADPTVTPEKVIRSIQSGHAEGILPTEGAQRAIAEVAAITDPQSLKQYLQNMQMKAVDSEKQIEMRKVNFANIDSGGRVVTQAQNPYSGQVTPVSSLTKTASPDAMLGSQTKLTEGAADRTFRAGESALDRSLRAAEGEASRGVTMRGQDITAEKEKALTDSQAKAVLFASRMQASNKIIEGLAEAGTSTSIPGSRAPYIGPAVSAMSGEKKQQLDQAKRDFVNAVLRRESGASISSSEFDNAEKQYFPQIGDSDAVKAQKTENRRIAIEGFKAEIPSSKSGMVDKISRVDSTEKPGGDPNVLKFFGKK